jgi:hypothetical protein
MEQAIAALRACRDALAHDNAGSLEGDFHRRQPRRFREVNARGGRADARHAVWPCSPAGGTTWRYLLDQFYNNPVYAPLVYTQSGKQVVFLPFAGANCYDAGKRALIEANGGRANVVTVPMWALFGEAAYEQGAWGFFSPCTDGAAYTSSMLDVGACAQRATLRNGSSEIVEVSASGGYMLSAGVDVRWLF